MMNLMALCLVVISLAAAGVWSPTPVQNQNRDKEFVVGKEDVIVKEGHRVIVVEYDQDGHRNTKVSISSPDQQDRVSVSDVGEDISSTAKDKIKEASSVLPNLGQGLSEGASQSDETEKNTPRELICDAFGKCKHKIATVIGKAKHKATETAEEEAETVGDALGKAKERVSKKVHDVEESAKESVETAKDRGKTIGKNIATNVSEKVERAKEEAVEKAREAKETAEDKAKTGADKLKKEMNEIIKYMKSAAAVDSLMGVLNLLGLATAYGMCVWVTFISSHILAVSMQRQQFGMVQSKIYPVYFRAMAYCIGMALFGHLLGNRKKWLLFSSSSKAEMFQVYNLWASLLMVFANSLYLEPRATKVMFERMKMEKEEGRGRGREELADDPTAASTTTSTTAAAPSSVPEGSEKEVIRSQIGRLNDRLKKLNTYSSFLNILTLMALTWHLVYLGQRLHLTC